MTIYNIADLLTGFAEVFMIFILCETFFTKKETLPYWIYGVTFAILAITISINNINFSFGILNIVVMILAFFVVSMLYESIISAKIIVSVLQYLILAVTEVLVLFIIILVYDSTVADVVHTASYRLPGIIASKMLAFLFINIIRYKYKGNNYMGTTYWFLFFLMFLISTATIFLIFKLSYDSKNASMYNLSVICSFGLLFSTFFSIYLYRHLAKQAEIIKNQQQYELHLKTQLEHLDEILATQEQIKKFRHDFNNYTIGLQAYIEHNDCAGAKKYLESLKEKITLDNNIHTGNLALDAILNAKKAVAEKKDIHVSTKIQIPQRIAIDPVDICTIFGNALDNAIEACERTKSLDKRISVTIICQDSIVFCKIVNTAPNTVDTTLSTSKKNTKNHGFGLKNIKIALSKYDSLPDIKYNGKEFILKFVIFTK